MADATTNALTAPLSSGQCEFDLKSKVGGIKTHVGDFKELARGVKSGRVRERERERQTEICAQN